MRIVSSLDELVRLPRDRYVNGFGARECIRLEIPQIARHLLIHAQQSLNRLQSRCGCLAGSITMLTTLGVGVVYVYGANGGALSWSVLRQVPAVLFAAFVSGLVAKLLTLIATRWQFTRECRVQYRALLPLVQPVNIHH